MEHAEYGGTTSCRPTATGLQRGGQRGNIRDYFYDLAGRVVEEWVQDGPLDATARPDRRYVWGVDGELLLADVNGSGAVKLVADGVLNFRFYPLADLEGNVVALVRGEKLDGRMEWNVRQRCAYTPLGELALLEGDYQAASTPLMGWDLFFGGLSREAATGLDYSHAGFYHPNLGLVLNGGGIGHVDEAELYAYVQPTPTDASGFKRRV